MIIVKQMITEEEAKKLLFQQEENSSLDNNIFDVYGNYNFPTDITVNEPNIAVGTVKTYILNK